MPRSTFLPAALVAAALGTPAIVNGQTLAPPIARPQQGLFSHAPKGDQSLGVSLSTLGSYDDNLFGEGSGLSDPTVQKSGSYGSLITNVSYSKSFRYVGLGVSEASTFRYYPTLSDVVGAQHAGTAGFVLLLNDTQVRVRQTLGYSPLFSVAQPSALFSPEVAQLPPPTSDLAVVKREARLAMTAFELKRSLGLRTSFSVTANHESTDYIHETSGLSSNAIGGSLSHKMTRNLSLVAGYNYQQGTYLVSAEEPTILRVHNIDLGVDYTRPLGATRRTTIAFTTGSTIVEDSRAAKTYRVIGDARLNREIGRTWHATAAYHRGVGLVEGFAQPFFSDSVGFDIGGSATSRVQLSADGRFSIGQLGVLTSGGGSDSYRSTGRARVALSRQLTFVAEYLYYRYNFEQAVALPTGVPQRLNRQGFRIGFDVWLPLIN